MKVFDSLNRSMNNQATINDVISNNLSNVSTGGFKKTLTALVTRKDSPGPEVVRRIDEAPGGVSQTSSPLDLTLDGKGFFAVEAAGGTRYTRNGCFKLNSSGEVTTQSGNRVLGEKGPLVVKGNKVIFSEQGDMVVDGVLQDKLRLVTIPAEQMAQQEGTTLITAAQGAVPGQFQGRVQQYYLENSNVSPVGEMVNLIDKLRIFQTLGKIVQTQDDLYSKIVMLNSRS